MLPFYVLNAFLHFEFMALPADTLGIAVFNTVFKVAATLVQLPFTGGLVRLSMLTIKDAPGEDDEEFEENLLAERFLDYPPLAIGTYLIHLNSQDLNERERLLSSHYLHCLTNLERISDHAVHIAEIARELEDKGISFSPDGLADMNRAVDAVREIVALTRTALADEDMAEARKVEPLEEVISVMLEGIKLRHIRRLQSGVCTMEMGFAFNDVLTDFARVAAHCSNVALAVLELRVSDLQFHDYARGVRQGDQPEFRRWLAFYQDKYLLASRRRAAEAN